MTYTWDFGDGTGSNYLYPTHLYEQPGSFVVTLEVYSPNGCKVLYTIPTPVEVYPTAVADFELEPDTVTVIMPEVLFTNNSYNANEWYWDFGDGSSSTIFQPTHSYSEYGTFPVLLIATNQFGCSDTAEHNVVVIPEFTFYIPSAFTPNDDFKNEVFRGYGTCINEFEMYLFDRWGNKFFESFDIEVGWDGKANGGAKIAQNDVYVYQVRIRDCLGNKHKYTGRFSLVK